MLRGLRLPMLTWVECPVAVSMASKVFDSVTVTYSREPYSTMSCAWSPSMRLLALLNHSLSIFALSMSSTEMEALLGPMLPSLST